MNSCLLYLSNQTPIWRDVRRCVLVLALAIGEPAYSVERAWEAEQIEIRAYAPASAVLPWTMAMTTAFACLLAHFGGNADE